MKNASNDDVLLVAPAGSATFAIGTSTCWNFASCTFFSITRFVPFSLTTRSSFGRLNAAVCTPRLASPAVKTTLTTRIGASAPSFGLRYFGIDRQRVLELLQVARRTTCSFFDSASSRSVMNASNAALKLNHSSS